MTSDIHRYRFDSSIAFEDIEATLILAIFATESLHGDGPNASGTTIDNLC